MGFPAFVRARRGPLFAVPLIIASGLGARACLSGLAAKVAGDALYAVLLYVIVLLLRVDVRPSRAFAVAVGVSFGVELAQLTPYPAWLSSKHVLLRLVLGSTFGFVDLAAYAIGAGGALGIHTALRRVAARAWNPR
jgi:hypothetical protein